MNLVGYRVSRVGTGVSLVSLDPAARAQQDIAVGDGLTAWVPLLRPTVPDRIDIADPDATASIHDLTRRPTLPSDGEVVGVDVGDATTAQALARLSMLLALDRRGWLPIGTTGLVHAEHVALLDRVVAPGVVVDDVAGRLARSGAGATLDRIHPPWGDGSDIATLAVRAVARWLPQGHVARDLLLARVADIGSPATLPLWDELDAPSLAAVGARDVLWGSGDRRTWPVLWPTDAVLAAPWPADARLVAEVRSGETVIEVTMRVTGVAPLKPLLVRALRHKDLRPLAVAPLLAGPDGRHAHLHLDRPESLDGMRLEVVSRATAPILDETERSEHLFAQLILAAARAASAGAPHRSAELLAALRSDGAVDVAVLDALCASLAADPFLADR